MDNAVTRGEQDNSGKTIIEGYKVRDGGKGRICGLAATSLKQLKEKAIKKFNKSDKAGRDEYSLVLLDGTLVEDEAYFATLPSQSLLLLLRPGEEDIPLGAELVYHALRSVNIDYLRTGQLVKEFFESEIKEKLRVLARKVQVDEETAEERATHSSHRKDDSRWFKGLETNSVTKEDFLRRRCKDRISGYYYKTASELKKICIADRQLSSLVLDLLASLKSKLTKAEWNGKYFDRRDKERLCNHVGLFTCQGRWNKDRCLYAEGGRAHLINPYTSPEERIIFSTWNLDHRVEKSRTILPTVITALSTAVLPDPKRFHINSELLYLLLFTTYNLKLVHIVCHDKSAHTSATLSPLDIILMSDSTNDKTICLVEE